MTSRTRRSFLAAAPIIGLGSFALAQADDKRTKQGSPNGSGDNRWAAWTFDDETGADSSGNERPLKLVGGSFTKGKDNKSALHLNGKDEHGVCDEGKSLKLGKNFAIGLSFKLDKGTIIPDKDKNYGLLSTNLVNGFLLELNFAVGPKTGKFEKTVQFHVIHPPKNDYAEAHVELPIEEEVWHSVVVLGGGGQIQLVFDGFIYNDPGSNANNIPNDPNVPLYLGCRYQGGKLTDHFKGAIDNVVIWTA